MTAPATQPRQTTIDVAHLPDFAFGSRDLMFWGTLGFILIEGATLAVCAVSYFYLRKNFGNWPPPRTPLPSLTIPVINLVVFAASLVSVTMASRAAKVMDLGVVRIGLLVTAVLSVVTLVLRYFEFVALNTRWDENAYGSITWMILAFHATVQFTTVGELVGIAALSYSSRFHPKHFPAVQDSAVYWWFVTLAWYVLFIIVFLGARVL